MNITHIPIQNIRLNPENPRVIQDAAFKRLVRSVQEAPWMLELRPLVVDSTLMVIGGNMRLKAALNAGLKTVPVLRVETLTPEQRDEFIIKDNLPYGEWAWEELRDNWDVEQLAEWGLELPPLTIEPAEATEDDFDVPPEGDIQTDIVLGDIITIGPHRLMCGDSCNIQHVEQLMRGEKVGLIVTDPPYNNASDSKNYVAPTRKSANSLKNAEWDKNFDIESALASMRAVTKESYTAYIWTSHFLVSRIWAYFQDQDYVSYLVWNKPNPMPSLSKRHPTWSTELCAYIANGKDRIVNFPKEGHFVSCLTASRTGKDGSHITQKPVKLIEPLIQFSSNENDMLLDLFLGSGTTMVAAHQLGRVCYGMEISPKYCQIIINRMLKLDPTLRVSNIGTASE